MASEGGCGACELARIAARHPRFPLHVTVCNGSIRARVYPNRSNWARRGVDRDGLFSAHRVLDHQRPVAHSRQRENDRRAASRIRHQEPVTTPGLALYGNRPTDAGGPPQPPEIRARSGGRGGDRRTGDAGRHRLNAGRNARSPHDRLNPAEGLPPSAARPARGAWRSAWRTPGFPSGSRPLLRHGTARGRNPPVARPFRLRIPGGAACGRNSAPAISRAATATCC
jgi:hypothetical protein